MVWSKTESIPVEPNATKGSVYDINVFGEIPSPKLWSAEFPNLYTLTITLYDSENLISQVEACRIGFRTVDIVDGVLTFNRKPIVIAGINRHDHDPDHGKVVSYESMKKDIEILK